MLAEQFKKAQLNMMTAEKNDKFLKK